MLFQNKFINSIQVISNEYQLLEMQQKSILGVDPYLGRGGPYSTDMSRKAMNAE